MEIVAAVTSTAGIVRILEHMGLPTVAPTVHPPRPPPQRNCPSDASGFEPEHLDFAFGRNIRNLAHLRSIGRNINHRLLTIERVVAPP
jgi:hypothetical protein